MPGAPYTESDRFMVSCQCGFKVISPDLAEVKRVASEHVNPGMGEFAADLDSPRAEAAFAPPCYRDGGAASF